LKILLDHKSTLTTLRKIERKITLLSVFVFFLISIVCATDMNVVGTALEVCSLDPLTGFHRDGHCRHDTSDAGLHLVCAQVDESFLHFSKSRGNDLFAVVSPGQHWCLCVDRWKEAALAQVAPRVKLEATHRDALRFVSMWNLHHRTAQVAPHQMQKKKPERTEL
jgi:uncharacterized protein (DUF2237 family)